MKILSIVLLGAAACATPDQTSLRAAVDQAEVSLGDSVKLAEASMQYSAGVEAALRPGASPSYTVGMFADSTKHRLTIDLGGRILASAPAGSASGACQTTISLSEALAIAEAEAGGNAVAVVPDDDDPCMREIQVLVDVTLWEVKLGPDGAVVEKELSDETL